MIIKCDNIYIVYICYMYWYEMFYIIKIVIKLWVGRCLLLIVLILYNIINLFLDLEIFMYYYRFIFIGID